MANDNAWRCLTWAIIVVLVAVVLYYGWMWWQGRLMPVTPAGGNGNKTLLAYGKAGMTAGPNYHTGFINPGMCGPCSVVRGSPHHWRFVADIGSSNLAGPAAGLRDCARGDMMLETDPQDRACTVCETGCSTVNRRALGARRECMTEGVTAQAVWPTESQYGYSADTYPSSAYSGYGGGWKDSFTAPAAMYETDATYGHLADTWTDPGQYTGYSQGY